MGTWTTDVLGQNLARREPTKQERTLARRIARRWKEWHPLLLHELRSRPHPPGHVSREMLRLEQRHAWALTHLLISGVSWRLVCRHRHDDPRHSDREHEHRIAHPRGAELPLSTQEKIAASIERKRLREQAKLAADEASRLARGLTPDKSVEKFLEERDA